MRSAEMDEFVERVEQSSDIVAVVSQYVALKRKGGRFWGCCPFHQEHTPSFSVVPDKGFFYCFGCHAGGNVFKFLSLIENVSYFEAIKLQAEKLGIPIPERPKSPQEREREQKLQDLLKVNEMARTFFHNCLVMTHYGEEGKAYFAGRGISAETIEEFSLGYAPDAWDKLTGAFLKRGVPEAYLVECGLAQQRREGGVYDRFRHRVMIPIADERGRIVGFGGRVLDDSKPKYLNSPESPLFSKSRELFGLYDALRAGTRPGFILIVEGYMDVIALAQYGVTNAVASLGTATTPEQLRLIFASTDHLVCCYDGDAPGRKAAWHTLMTALPVLNGSRKISFLFLPPEDDPDSFVRAHGKEGFLDYLREHEMGLTDFIFDHERRGLGNSRDDQITLLSRVIDCAVRMQQDSPCVREIKETFRPGGRFPGFEESYIFDGYIRYFSSYLIAIALACPGAVCEISDLGSTMQVFSRMSMNPAAMLLLDVIRVAQRNGGRDSAASLLREFSRSPCILWLRHLARRSDIDREAALDSRQAKDEFRKDLEDILTQEIGQRIEELRRMAAAGTATDSELAELQKYAAMRAGIEEDSISGSGRS